MKNIIFIIAIVFSLLLIGETMLEAETNYNKLTKDEKRVIEQKGTERPFSGIYNNHKEEGSYLCKKCESPLFTSTDKFSSSCGWPSFDDAIDGAVEEKLDADGRRTEIVCANCGAHLGHVFRGEKLTDKNTRHCVNSISLNFRETPIVPTKILGEEIAYFAGGCFWGVEYHLNKLDGVKSTEVGYMGGDTDSPDYRDVSSGSSGHAEAVKVVFDPNKTSFEEISKLFFEIHDPSQYNRQGPDIGDQYRSAIFYTSPAQFETSKELVNILKSKGYDVVTALVPADQFYSAEDYHQDYYQKKGSNPYCHIYQKKF